MNPEQNVDCVKYLNGAERVRASLVLHGDRALLADRAAARNVEVRDVTKRGKDRAQIGLGEASVEVGDEHLEPALGRGSGTARAKIRGNDNENRKM